jgi:hypothetical protein
MRILLEMFKWVVDKVNSIGQPKKSNSVPQTEVISAIKVKNNQSPVNSAASTTFADTKTKPSYGKSGAVGTSGAGGKTGKPGKSNPYANNSTSAKGYYPQYAIDKMDEVFNDMDNVFNEMNDVFVKIDDDLERLLSGGSNVRPTDISNMYKSKKVKSSKK